MEANFFSNKVIPFIESDTEKLDKEDIKALKKRWAEFSKLDGIKKLFCEGEYKEALAIFSFAISL